mgnify:CR=1
MKTQSLVIDTNTNVGTMHRYIRFASGASLIAIPLFYQGVDTEYAALTSLIAIPVIFTTITRWCPLYALLHARSITYQNDIFWFPAFLLFITSSCLNNSISVKVQPLLAHFSGLLGSPNVKTQRYRVTAALCQELAPPVGRLYSTDPWCS